MEFVAILLTLVVVIGSILGIVLWRLPADGILLAGLCVLLIHGAIDPAHGLSVKEGLAGFGNPGVITVALLFVVAEGIQRTGALTNAATAVLGRPNGLRQAQLRTMLPAMAFSSVFNNTPVVALMTPVLRDWARKYRMPVSHLLMPLSYAAILGGMWTLIGTSTTIVVDSLLPTASRFSMFELAWVGLPASFAAAIVLLILTPKLLPVRTPAFSAASDPREYTVEMQVEAGSPLVGRSIEAAGLRNLPGMYLMEVERRGVIMPAVSPETRLEADDHLVFVGVVESVVDLRKIPGLQPATDQHFKLSGSAAQRCLVEAVVSSSYPYLRMTIRESSFRSHYNAAIIAVCRDGARLPGKIGDIRLQPGDTLLLESHDGFIEQQRNSRHFFLVSAVENSTPVQHEKAARARTVLMGFVATVGLLGMLDVRDAPLLASFAAALLMILFRCVRTSDARRCIDWNVVLVMAAGLGIGQAMDATGTGQFVIKAASSLTGDSPHLMLAAVYLLTVTLSNLITAKAAAVLCLNIAMSAAETLELSDPKPFAVAVIMGAAGSFVTPYGYQTNMMVMGPGGYRSSDYIRLGLPVTAAVGVVTVLLTPLFWPLG